MKNLENIAAAGIDFEIRGKSYKIGVLTLRDIADFRNYIKAQRLNVARSIPMPEMERIKLMSEVLNSFVDEMQEMQTMEGIMYLLWKCLIKFQPDMKLTEVSGMVGFDNLKEVTEVIMQLGGTVKNVKKAKAKKS